MIEEFDEFDDEFDIQTSVLKKRVVAALSFFVEYDKLSSNVITISPIEIEPESSRHAVIKIDDCLLIQKLFKNKISLSKLIVRKNNGVRELAEHAHKIQNEFDFVFANNTLQSFIHITCDHITKQIEISLHYNILKEYLAKELITESQLLDIPEYIDIFCVDLNEKSRLLDKLTVDTKQLFDLQVIRYYCDWLPNIKEQIQNVGFLYYNNQSITTGSSIEYNETSNLELKPSVLYKQDGNILRIQSAINDFSSYRLDDEFKLYIFDKHDPSRILESITLNSSLLNNYNYFEVNLEIKEEIRIVSNYSHLHIEDLDVSTYYQF